MVGGQDFWWNQETPKDKALRGVIDVAKRLMRLPKRDDMTSAQEKFCMQSCITYFDSFENALKEAARLLYGHADLTSPFDLLPNEQELPEPEQKSILERRLIYYRAAVEELSDHRALRKLREKAKAQQETLEREKRTMGCTVKKIPPQTRKELRAAIGQEQLAQEARSTNWLNQAAVAPHPSSRRMLSLKERQEKFMANWRASNAAAQRANFATVSRQISPGPATANQISPTQKGDDEMGGPRVTKERALVAVKAFMDENGKMPTQTSYVAFNDHRHGQFPAWASVCNKLGPKDTWEKQLEERFGPFSPPDDEPKPPEGDGTAPLGAEPSEKDSPAPPENDPSGEAPPPSGEDVTPPEDALESPGEEAAPPPPEGATQPESEHTPEAADQSAPPPIRHKLKLSLHSVTLRFCLDDQEYELDLEFG